MTEEIQALVAAHSRIKAAEADVTSAEESAKVSLGDWFPTVSFTAGIGYERQFKGNGTDDTSMPPRDANVTVDQKVWDFGATNAGIERSRLSEDQARDNLVSTRQSLILEGVTAYLDVMRQHKLVKFARSSVENIKRQAELEDSRVQRGSGFTTDVLQAKQQLAGAEARLIQAQGGLKVALNRYRAVFGHDSGPIDEMTVPATPFGELPETLDEAISVAIRDNPGLLSAAKDAEILRATERETRADELFPSLDASLSQTVEEDADGTVGNSSETLLLLELSYDFGVTGSNHSAVYAAQQDAIASENRYTDARDLVEEQVRNAWDNLATASENARYLSNQADIAAEFLELARKERELGNRTLIDVLSGETALINASSDAASAETDVAVAVYTLLSAMGKLEM